MPALSMGNWEEKLMIQLLGIQKWSEITVKCLTFKDYFGQGEHIKNWEIQTFNLFRQMMLRHLW